MKKLILPLIIAGALAFSGCEKEQVPSPNPFVSLLVDEDPQSVVDTLEANIFNNPLTSDVSASTNAVIMDYPLFLDYDPFTAVVVRGNNVDSCVKGIEITKSERELLNSAWKSKIECQSANKKVLYSIHRKLEVWAKEKKDSLYLDYQSKRNYVLEAYSKGLLTLDQKNEAINKLELAYKQSLLNVNSSLKEKIKNNLDRAEACGKIKDCEKIWLNSVLEILGKTRYKKWIECYKYNYKKK